MPPGPGWRFWLYLVGDRISVNGRVSDSGSCGQLFHRFLRQLVTEGRLIVEAAGRSTRYRSATFCDKRRYPIDGLEEDRVWDEMSDPSSVMATIPNRPRAIFDTS